MFRFVFFFLIVLNFVRKESRLNDNSMRHLCSLTFQDFIFLWSLSGSSCLSVEYKEICLNETELNTTLPLCLLSNQGPTQAQAPSPSEGRQLNRNGEWSARFQINPYCHHNYIPLTHTNTHTVHLDTHDGANGYWSEIRVGLRVPK